MSLNFDHNSNQSLVRRFQTVKTIVKMCQFYSDSSRFFFFATNCTAAHILPRWQKHVEKIVTDLTSSCVNWAFFWYEWARLKRFVLTSCHTGENSQILTVSNKKTFFSEKLS
jgi:hypothetical protein